MIDQILIIDSDVDGNARKINKIKSASAHTHVKASVNSGIALLYLQQQNELAKQLNKVLILNVDTPIMNGFEFLVEYRGCQSIEKQNILIVVWKDNLSDKQIEKFQSMGINNFIEEENFCLENLSKMAAKKFHEKDLEQNNTSNISQIRGLHAA